MQYLILRFLYNRYVSLGLSKVGFTAILNCLRQAQADIGFCKSFHADYHTSIPALQQCKFL